MKFDLHMHTTRYSPDSRMEPLDLVRRARQVGLDGVVITEHDWLWTETELEELRAAEPGLVVLAGMEVSCREGHFLAYGVRDPSALPHGIGVAALCREAGLRVITRGLARGTPAARLAVRLRDLEAALESFQDKRVDGPGHLLRGAVDLVGT